MKKNEKIDLISICYKALVAEDSLEKRLTYIQAQVPSIIHSKNLVFLLSSLNEVLWATNLQYEQQQQVITQPEFKKANKMRKEIMDLIFALVRNNKSSENQKSKYTALAQTKKWPSVVKALKTKRENQKVASKHLKTTLFQKYFSIWRKKTQGKQNSCEIHTPQTREESFSEEKEMIDSFFQAKKERKAQISQNLQKNSQKISNAAKPRIVIEEITEVSSETPNNNKKLMENMLTSVISLKKKIEKRKAKENFDFWKEKLNEKLKIENLDSIYQNISKPNTRITILIKFFEKWEEKSIQSKKDHKKNKDALKWRKKKLLKTFIQNWRLALSKKILNESVTKHYHFVLIQKCFNSLKNNVEEKFAFLQFIPFL